MTTPNIDPNAPAVTVTAIEAPIAPLTMPQQVPAPQPTIQPVTPVTYTAQDIERAREQEKAKLYTRQKELADELAALKAATKQSTATAEQTPSPELVELRQTMQQMAQQVSQLTATNAQEAAARRTAELTLFMNQRITAYQAAGHGLVMRMIGGVDEQSIEASIVASAQEYAAIVATIQPAAPQQHPITVQVQATPAASYGFPSVPNAQSVASYDPGQQNFIEQVNVNTTPDAVRNGDYAKNRPQIMASLRSQTSGIAGSMSNAPRYMPTPGQLPPSTWQNVQQPQALPTPQVQAPQYQQPQQFAQPQMPQVAPPQYIQQPAVQLPQYPQPQQPGIDVASIRAHAISTVTQHLANPGSAPPAPLPNGRTPGTHAEYANRNGVTGAPNGAPVQASFNGQNPMIRNS